MKKDPSAFSFYSPEFNLETFEEIFLEVKTRSGEKKKTLSERRECALSN